MFWARVFTIYYFAHFLVVMPLVGWFETPLKVPGSITEAVLGKSAKRQAGAEQGLTGALPMQRPEPMWRAAAVALFGSLALAGAALPTVRLPMKAAGSMTSSARTGRSAASPASSTRRSCSAASRSTSRSARPVTASSACASATSRSPAGRSSRKRGQGACRLVGRTRSRTSPTTRAIQSTGARPRRPHHRPLQERQAGARGAERRAAARPVAHRQGAQRREPRALVQPAGSTCCATWPPATRRAGRLSLCAADRLSRAARPACK